VHICVRIKVLKSILLITLNLCYKHCDRNILTIKKVAWSSSVLGPGSGLLPIVRGGSW
jgi:hypothetical protein